jgi:23S rRNA (guanosine2251-2'-O)-methyltransferase
LTRRRDSGAQRPDTASSASGRPPRARADGRRPGKGRGRGAPSRGRGGREWIHGLHSIAEALAASRRDIHALWLKKGPPRRELEPLVEAARAAGVAVRTAEADELAGWVGDDAVNWQGAVLEAGPIPVLAGIGPLLRAQPVGPVRLVALDGVEDPQNVGAIARVADAAGAGGLLMTERRAPPLSPAVSRASAGAIEWLPVARVPNLVRALEGLKERGLWVLGADLRDAEPLWQVSDALLEGDFVLVMGAEGRGLRPSTRAAVDLAVEIPMGGRVASLNVATATAVLLFEAMRRSRPAGD